MSPCLSGLATFVASLDALLTSLVPTSTMDGGDEEARTPDPLLAKQVLSQLSYTPNSWLSPPILWAIPFEALGCASIRAFKIKQY